MQRTTAAEPPHPVYRGNGATVYQVADAEPTPISPLLKGDYRHCETSTIS